MFAKCRIGQTDPVPADDTDPEKISGSDKKIIIYRSGKIEWVRQNDTDPEKYMRIHMNCGLSFCNTPLIWRKKLGANKLPLLAKLKTCLVLRQEGERISSKKPAR